MSRNGLAIIMAGATGTLLKSGMPSVMAEVMGKPLVGCVASSVISSGIKKIVTVVPSKDIYIKNYLAKTFPENYIDTVVVDALTTLTQVPVMWSWPKRQLPSQHNM